VAAAAAAARAAVKEQQQSCRKSISFENLFNFVAFL
jgi:uncharacterized membrane protein YadS